MPAALHRRCAAVANQKRLCGVAMEIVAIVALAVTFVLIFGALSDNDVDSF
jgi:hypothetical protein